MKRRTAAASPAPAKAKAPASPAAALPLTVTHLDVHRGATRVLQDVSFHLPAGEVLAVVGPNGAGKSTLLRAITGITSASAGHVSAGEHRLSGRGVSARRRAHLLSFVSQEETPAPELTVTEATALGRTPYRKPWASHDPEEHEAIASALHTVGLEELAHAGCGALSGGQRHRVVLARALAQRAPIMLLDEPTNHLDPVWRLRLLQALRNAGHTVIFSVHDLDSAMQFADKVAVLHEQRLAAFGPPREVFTPELMARVFGVASAIVARPGAEAMRPEVESIRPEAEPAPQSQSIPAHLLLWAMQKEAP